MELDEPLRWRLLRRVHMYLFTTAAPAARSAVLVARLPNDALVEIEVIAGL